MCPVDGAGCSSAVPQTEAFFSLTFITQCFLVYNFQFAFLVNVAFCREFREFFSFTLLFLNLWIVTVCCIFGGFFSILFFYNFPHSTNLLPSAAPRRDNTTTQRSSSFLVFVFCEGHFFTCLCLVCCLHFSFFFFFFQYFFRFGAGFNGRHRPGEWGSFASISIMKTSKMSKKQNI